MQYSLLNRFRGALLGSFIGEILVGSGLGQVVGTTLTRPKPEEAQSDKAFSDWSQIATCGTESLIRCGKLDVEDWVLYSSMMQPSLLRLKAAASSSEAVVAMLPIALFFHEDEVKLRQQLLQAAMVWQKDSSSADGVLAVAYAIALALTEKLNIATLIPQTLAYLGTPQTPLTQQLKQVQTLLEQGAGLDATLTQLRREQAPRSEPLSHSYTSIALAFYCFLNTPEDFHLCVTRAARTGCQPQTTAAIAGALSGVYNSIIGIPIGWRLTANQTSTGLQRRQLAECLLAVWSGVYNVSAAIGYPLGAVAAPRVIQPR